MSAGRFERPTSTLGGLRSIHLNYVDILLDFNIKLFYSIEGLWVRKLPVEQKRNQNNVEHALTTERNA